MPKVNYIRSLIESLSEEELQALTEEYAKKDKAFEAFVVEKSGKPVETGKHYQDYYDELQKIVQKCKSRRYGFYKVTRVNNAGMASYVKLLQSHFQNENFRTAMWMALAGMEALHQIILANRRYSWGNKPYKTFEKLFIACRDQFDTSYKFSKIARKDRPQLFQALIRCWWRDCSSTCEESYFEIDDVMRYTKRDEDLLTLQLCLKELQPTALEIDKKVARKKPTWEKVVAGLSGKPETGTLTQSLNQLEARIEQALNEWN